MRSIRCCCQSCAGRIHFLCIADWLEHTASPESGETASRAAHPSNRTYIEPDPAPAGGILRPVTS